MTGLREEWPSRTVISLTRAGNRIDVCLVWSVAKKPAVAPISTVVGEAGYAAATRRRRQASSPPKAIAKPGKPAPTIGPGTAATSIETLSSGMRQSA